MSAIEVSLILMLCVVGGSVIRTGVGILTKPADEPFQWRKLLASFISAVIMGVIAGGAFLPSNTTFDTLGLFLQGILALKLGWNTGKDVGSLALSQLDKIAGGES